MDMIKGLYRSVLPERVRRAVSVYRKSQSAVIMLSPKYNDDGVATNHLPTFRDDPDFQKAYARGRATGALDGLGFDIEWRAHVACFAAWHGLQIEGDFVECGVGRGLLSRTLTSYLDFAKSGKTLYLIDTFEGLPEEVILDAEKGRTQVDKMKTVYKDNYPRVAETFKDVPNVKLVKGRVPEVLSQVDIKKVAYLSIDMNNVQPEIAAAEYFWDKLSPSAMIVLDDFAYGEEYILQTRAFLDFAKRMNVKILTLPTGQGVMIK